MKIGKMMLIDIEVYKEFQNLFPREASSFCNEQMRLRIASQKGSVKFIDMELLKLKQKELLKEADKKNAELIVINEQLKTQEEETKNQEVKRLEEEKEKIEALTKCDGCGFQMHEIAVTTKKGLKFCKECFFNEHPKLLEKLKND